MSSGEEDYGSKSGAGDDPKASKKRRIQRACDTCRRKKIRCDGATTTSNKCSNCTAYNFECTYVEAAKKRGPPKGYVESLESRLQKMETLLQRLCPDADFTQELGVHMDRETWYNERHKRGNASPAPLNSATRKSRPSSPGIHAATTVSDDFVSDEDRPAPSEELGRLTVTSLDRRFHGKSSGLVLVQTAIDMKREYTGGNDMPSTCEPIPKQEEFWAHPEWEGKRSRAPDDNINFEFPPPDLMDTLIGLYFFRNNLYLPLLHRPTFERQYRERLHESDRGFACTLLLVCAIASRCTDDPRVLRPYAQDGKDGPSRHSAGWKYFDQLQLHRKSLISPATLFDLQQYALAGIFLQGSAAPYASWVMVGIGLRVAQDVGAHRKKVSDSPVTVDDELWKRAFWVLVNLDRLGSSALGRPCAIHDEDFDLDPPLEVDDEFWESPNPEEAFQQPADRPSTVAYFNAFIKLDQILSFALRTIYSINKSKILLGFVGPQWEQHTVAELDSALNQWIDSVPEHLRWDPTQEFSVFFQQSAILYATYYHIQILVHRPFIPSPRTPAPLSFPSLSICTNAARSCSHVLEAQRRKCDAGPAPHLMFYAFTSGLVLLLNIWGIRKPGGLGNTQTPMHHVHLCMQFLKAAEKQWHLAGRLQDILCDLASVGDFPLPQASPEISNKRERDSDSPKSAPTPEFNLSLEAANHSRPTIPRRRPPSSIAPRGESAQLPAGVSSTDFGPMPLPMNTDELARLPLHPPFIQQQGEPSGSGNDMPGMQWFTQDQNLPRQGPFGQPPGGPPPFGSGQDGQQTYLTSTPPFVTGFPQQQQPGSFPNPGQPMPGGEQIPTWGDTLDMWSTAPPGFDWEGWNHFTTNIIPRDDQDAPPS